MGEGVFLSYKRETCKGIRLRAALCTLLKRARSCKKKSLNLAEIINHNMMSKIRSNATARCVSIHLIHGCRLHMIIQCNGVQCEYASHPGCRLHMVVHALAGNPSFPNLKSLLSAQTGTLSVSQTGTFEESKYLQKKNRRTACKQAAEPFTLRKPISSHLPPLLSLPPVVFPSVLPTFPTQRS